MTFAELLSAVYDECGYGSSPATQVQTRVRRWINQGMRSVLSQPGLQRLQDRAVPYEFTTTANRAQYSVPGAQARIISITERTNDRALMPMSLEQYRVADPDPTVTSGTSVAWVPIGRVGVATQPSDSSQVFVVSTSASDTATAYVAGVLSNGEVVTDTVTMTGTTAVPFSPTAFVEITDFYLAQAAVGTVTMLEDNSGGTELARILSGTTRSSYLGFYLWPTPASAITYFVDARMRTTDLVNGEDQPPWEEDFHDLLVDYAVMRHFEHDEKPDRFIQAKARYDARLSQLKYFTQTLPGELPVAGRGRLIGHSRLGAWFPADYYTRG